MSALAVVTRPTDGETDDRNLVARVRAGDDRAFEILFRRYQPRIGAYVRRMVHDDGRAEDITQEVFIAALRRMREETERDILFKPWIFEIAKNKCIDAFRRTRNASEVSFDARDAIGAAEHGRLAEPGATPDTAVEGKVAIDHLCGAFGGLSEVHHEILVLREFEGLSYREIGERLGMSRPAVESTLFRARKRLTEEYEELVSGARCVRVQRIVDESGASAIRLREQRRMARHLAHCQPCRRYAVRAGVDLGIAARPGVAAAAAARIAAFLPLPTFLRRRWGDGDEAVAPLGQGGSLGHWSANVATTLDPGLVSSWTKAVATAATVAVAGVGAGAALSERLPSGASGAAAVVHEQRSAQERGAAPKVRATRPAATVAVRRGESATGGGGDRTRVTAPVPSAAAGVGAVPPTPPATTAAPDRQAGRGADPGASAAPAADAGGEASALPAKTVERVIGSLGGGDPATTNDPGAATAAGSGLVGGAVESVAGTAAAVDRTATAVAPASDKKVATVTGTVGSVSTTVTDTLTSAITTLYAVAP